MLRRLLALPIVVLATIVAACAAPSTGVAPAPTAEAVGGAAVTAVPTTGMVTGTPAAPRAAATLAATPMPAAPTAAAPANAAASPTTPVGALPATATTAPATATTAPTAAPAAPSPTARAGTAQQKAGAIRLVTVPDGTQASFRVREQLAGRNFPNDAVGTTKDVTGTLTIQPDGTLAAGQSRFVVNLTTLQTDSGQRDRYIQRNTLETQRYPSATFVPTAVHGLAAPLPGSGDVEFQIEGDLTLHGSTHHLTWDATAHIAGQELTGSATTTFKFGDVGLTQPRAAVVLSVEDKVVLQIDFHMTAQGGTPSA